MSEYFYKNKNITTDNGFLKNIRFATSRKPSMDSSAGRTNADAQCSADQIRIHPASCTSSSIAHNAVPTVVSMLI